MRLYPLTVDSMCDITKRMFDLYVEPVSLSLMSGEVPNTTFKIYRNAESQDWLAEVKFKNTLTISVFKCDVYLKSILNFCRKCKLYLVTTEVFRVAVTFAMLHPLFQTQYMDFKNDVDADYDSMMDGATNATYRFISNHFDFKNDMENLALEIFRFNTMVFTNGFKYAPKGIHVGNHIADLLSEYNFNMQANYPLAFQTAKKMKAGIDLVDLDGFKLLEYKHKAGITQTEYVNKERENGNIDEMNSEVMTNEQGT